MFFPQNIEAYSGIKHIVSDMTDTNEILLSENWLQSKLYRNPNAPAWNLDWYHDVLRDVVRPFVLSTEEVQAVFFGIYGPTPYELENEDEYERKIAPPKSKVVFIRLRAYVGSDNKKTVRNKLMEMMDSHRNLVWDYEIFKEYRVRDDLGGRYGRRSDGSIDDNRTLLFIRYWDSGCRYILSILGDKGNWESNVDVWGIPHLINNSLGSWLRPPGAKCKKCGNLMYMATSVAPVFSSLLPQLSSLGHLPIFLFVCPNCKEETIRISNI
jgi:hypothetical protein